MIQRTSFLGISLRTIAHRRALVLGYYLVLIVFIAIPMYRHKFLNVGLLMQVFTLGTLFGGITTTGPVKYFGESTPNLDPDRLNPISLNLTGRFSPFAPSRLLDEREVATRDHAHYLAYKVLLITLFCAFFFVFLTAEWTLTFMEQNMATLLWGLLVLTLSLPQSVILWTEPEPMLEGGLALVEAKQ